MDNQEPDIPSQWLFDAVDMDEMESDWLDKPAPYGVSREAWNRLKSLMEAGDVIHAFSSPSESWEHLAGRAGYAVVRDGQAIVSVVTLMN
jgi:hypothetical protein